MSSMPVYGHFNVRTFEKSLEKVNPYILHDLIFEKMRLTFQVSTDRRFVSTNDKNAAT